MIVKTVLDPSRVRTITGSFAFIEHRFLRGGFLHSLSHHELLLYLFLVLAADRQGLSFYTYERICSLLHLCVDEYILARDGLIHKDLIAFDGTLFQVLELPAAAVKEAKAPHSAAVAGQIQLSLMEAQNGH